MKFSHIIEQLADNKAKIKVAEFYYPVSSCYLAALDCLNNEEYSDDKKKSHFITIFNAERISQSIQDIPVKSSKDFVNDFSFFPIHYPGFQITVKVNELETQRLRNQLFSFFKCVHSPVNSLCNIHKPLNARLESYAIDGKAIFGGAWKIYLGATLGSFFLPGPGTIIGAGIGGALGGGLPVYKKMAYIDENFISYYEKSELIIHTLFANIKELYLIYYKFQKDLYKIKIYDIYKELEESGLNGNLILQHYFQHEVDKTKRLLNSPVQSKASLKFQDEFEEMRKLFGLAMMPKCNIKWNGAIDHIYECAIQYKKYA